MHNANMVQNVVVRLQESLQHEPAPDEVTAFVQMIQDPQVNHLEKPVQYNQNKISAHIQQLQAMMQAMQLHYAAPQPYYQYYGCRGHYGVNKGFIVRREHGRKCQGNWRGGHEGSGSSGIDNYCCTTGRCNHQGTNFRDPEYGHQNSATATNRIPSNDCKCAWKFRSVPTNNSNVMDNINSITYEL